MKRMLCMLCAAMLLAASGCSQSAPSESEAGTTAAPIETETTGSVSEDTIEETSAPDDTIPTELIATTAPLQETSAGTDVSGQPPADTTPVSLPGDERPDVSIFGRWSYGGSYEMVFRQDYSVLLCTDYSEIMYMEDGAFMMHDVKTPLTIEPNRITATRGPETVLSMIPQEGADTANLTGRYLLEPCSVRSAVASADPTTPVYVNLTGARFLVETEASYRMDHENCILYMINESGTIQLRYNLSGDQMTISDSEGNTDELTRIAQQ